MFLIKLAGMYLTNCFGSNISYPVHNRGLIARLVNNEKIICVCVSMSYLFTFPQTKREEQKGSI